MQDCVCHAKGQAMAIPPVGAATRCNFCDSTKYRAPGPCSSCGVYGYKSEPPGYRKMPRTRYDDPPELLPTEPTWADLEDVTVDLF